MSRIEQRAESARSDTVKKEVRERKRKRANWGVQLQLEVPHHIRDKHPGMSFQWVNDEKGGVKAAESCDWEVVPEMANKPVGIGHTTNSMDAVLMMIPTEWKLEDERAQLEEALKHENSLRRGLSMSESGDAKAESGMYAANLDDGGQGYSRGTTTRVEAEI